MSDLLPCPFCNCLHAPGVLTINVGHSGGYHHVVCNTNYAGCGAQGAVASTPEHAIAAWNRRAPADPALLALARFGAWLVNEQWWTCEDAIPGFLDADGKFMDQLAVRCRVSVGDGASLSLAPGIADAISALLATDGAGEVAP